MKRRDVIRGIGASATLGVLVGSAAAAPPCDQCLDYCDGFCPDWCTGYCDTSCCLRP